MALDKQPISITFSKGVETKSDSKQVDIGNFNMLNNMVFTKTGQLTKRNGYPRLTAIGNTLQTTLTTLNDNLIATGSNLYAYSQDTNQWLNQGLVQPVQLSVQSLVRVSTSQTAPDAAVAPNGLTCLTYADGSNNYYQVSDSRTGQQIVARTQLPSTATNPRTFVLGQYFIITFMATVSASTHLQYIAIPIATPSVPGTATDISTAVSGLSAGYDGVVTNNALYMGWSGSGSTVKVAQLSSALVVGPATSLASHTATYLSMAAYQPPAGTPTVWLTFWDSSSTNAFAAAFNQNLIQTTATTQILTSVSLAGLTSVAGAFLSVFYEVLNNYNSTGAYPNTVKTDFVGTVTLTTGASVGTPTTILRSVGLASKPFITPAGSINLLVTYGETSQPTYFLIDSLGHIIMRLAYQNGGGYASSQVLPSVSLIGDTYYTPYLIKDFLVPINKGTGVVGQPVTGLYTQTGINLAKFSINNSGQYSSEIAGALHLTGGQLWEYDGVRPVEHGFQVWPENVAFTTATTGGGLTKQPYYYVFTYEWTDNAGELHRSAPSIPLLVDLTSSATATNVNTLYVPTLRLTYKVSPNPVRIVGYRWSAAQQNYYQMTSITSPATNNPGVDYITIVDSSADAAILGQTLLYTTGGVIEDIAAPACSASCLFKNRLFLVDAEDPNLLWYSKQVIESTPVEMSDLLTIYVAPTTGAQGSTGPVTALSAMDDKLIIFKRDAIYYLTGTGPDNTGASNDFSDPVYITASVGCSNPNSIVLMPTGIMFQSDKGIWLLGRDLSTQYIGSPVEVYNSLTVYSAKSIPGTNQVRFVLEDNITLMYDYFQGQWATHSNLAAISSTLFQGAHTYLNVYGTVLQETLDVYIDDSQPVLWSFTTSWVNLAGLQGFERFYFANLLGIYYTPFKLNMQMAYNYNPSPTQSVLITPDNYSPSWGGEANWGSGQAWGGPGDVFSARIFPQVQKCESFQITLTEIYDPSLGVAAGQGLSLSGLGLVIGVKKGYRTQSAGKSFG